MFAVNLVAIADAFSGADYVELGPSALIVHTRHLGEDREHMLRQLQHRMKALRSASGSTGRPSDELIAERRAEADRELGE